MDTDLDTFATTLYVTVDDLFEAHPERLPERPVVGIAPLISDAELIVLAVMQSLLGYRSEARWLRRCHKDFHQMFPRLPQQSGYNKRLKKLACVMVWLTSFIASLTPISDDDVWIVDSTPVECGRSRGTAQRSDLAGWADDGYCASHTRWFWGLRLHLVCTLHGLPVGWMITPASTNERDALEDMINTTWTLVNREGPTTIIADKGYRSKTLEHHLAEQGITLLRPAYKNEKPLPGTQFFKPRRHIIESVNNTLKTQLDLEQPGGRTPIGVCTRITQPILALVTTIWHNDQTRHTPRRSLIAYDH